METSDTNAEIIRLFSYTEDEQEFNPYLRTYMRKVTPHIPKIMADPAMRERFMLAGLYLSFLADNWGHSFSTEDKILNDLIRESIHTERLRAYKRFTGKSLMDTDDYRKLIGHGIGVGIFILSIPLQLIWRMFFLRPGNMLYKFVVHGNRPWLL